MKIKRWAVLTACLYATSLVLLIVPLIAVSLGGSPLRENAEKKGGNIHDAAQLFEVYEAPEYWIIVGVFTLLEGVLLLVPIQISRARPVGKQSWKALAVVSGLLMGLLVAAAGICIAVAVYLENGPVNYWIWVSLCLGLVTWIVSGVVFASYAASDPTKAFSKTIDRLLAGSIAELLVAVPCHVYVRQQEHCCAGSATFIGIATGLSVMLFAFGPGVFFLFVKRSRRLRDGAALRERETDAPERRVRRITGFTRRAGLWGLGALMLALLPVPLLLAPNFNTKEVWIVFRAAFVHAAAIACIYAVVAYRKKESFGTWVIAGAALLGEMALLQTWLLTH